MYDADISELYKRYKYYPTLGELWRMKGVPKKMRADSKIKIGKHRIRGYVVAWSMYHGRFPVYQIDHRDRNKNNIKIDNLREATHAQNNWNAAHQSTSGLKGASLMHNGKWQAGIHVDNERIHLGHYATKEEAHEAYCRAAKKYFGEFACLEVKNPAESRGD